MASLNSLMSDVYTLTNRPDLVAETRLAVKKATLKMHHSDFYPKDLFETGIAWDPVGFIQSLAYRTLIPNWRSFKYLRKYADGQAGQFFTLLSVDETLDRYAVNKENICYIAGEHLEIRSSTEDTNMLLGCYVHPTLTDTGYSSWIADEHPYAIITDAAASIFKMVGQDQEAAYYKQEIIEQIALLRQSQIV